MKSSHLLAPLIGGLMLAAPLSLFGASTSVDVGGGQAFIQISRKLIPAVVNIFTTSTIKMPWAPPSEGGPGGPDDLWRRFFEDFFGGEPFNGEPGVPDGKRRPGPRAQSLGSGFIIERTADGGIILTNNHVVEGADEIKIKFTEFSDEKESKADVIGRDADLDIAVLRVKTKRKLEPVALGDSDKLEVGEWIAAIGNPFGHGHSVTHGIVSAKERSLPGSFANYLQVDAPINPGNSGGPLVNLNGEVVGINNAIDARGPGIGFAIPINFVKAVLPQLKEKGRVDRGYIGINIEEMSSDLARQLKLDESEKGPIVTNVVVGEAAAKAGIQAYDVIVEVEGKRTRSPSELVAAITALPIGANAKIKVLRSGKPKIFEVKVSQRPDGLRKVRPDREKKKGAKPRVPKVDTGMVLETVDAEVAKELGLSPKFRGVVVSQVTPMGPAHRAGLRRGDIILEVDRKPVRSEEEFHRLVNGKRNYLLRVRRQDEGGNEVFSVVTLKLSAAATENDDDNDED